LTDRPIAIGPTVNVLLQKGIGNFIRSKLKRIGLDLRRSQTKHRELAKKASIDGSLATVDLRSASDTISWRAVIDLLPFDWFDMLDKCRSKEYCIDGNWYPYQKFSAMGNGYTFELETLIFYSLAFSVTKYLGLDTNDVSVYGDDIILPNEATPLLYRVLESFGFMINKEKSFCSGPFRESCGGDFFSGTDVRGFYVKERLSLRDIVRFRNYLYRSGWRYVLPKTWSHLRFLLKDYENLLAGPDDGTDDHIVFDNWSSRRAYNFVSLQSDNRHIPRLYEAARVYLLYKAMRSESSVQYLENIDDRKLACTYLLQGNVWSRGQKQLARTLHLQYLSNTSFTKGKTYLPLNKLKTKLLKRH